MTYIDHGAERGREWRAEKSYYIRFSKYRWADGRDLKQIAQNRKPTDSCDSGQQRKMKMLVRGDQEEPRGESEYIHSRFAAPLQEVISALSCDTSSLANIP
jgi:hypothetical protein